MSGTTFARHGFDECPVVSVSRIARHRIDFAAYNRRRWRFGCGARGIAVSHSRPYRPQTVGKDERFHGTLQRDFGRQPPRPDLAVWQASFDALRQEYNQVRPHEALALAVPASRYQVSPRPYPAELPPLPYGPDDQRRRVDAGGRVSFQGRRLRIP